MNSESPAHQTELSDDAAAGTALALPLRELRRDILVQLDIQDDALAESDESFWRTLAQRRGLVSTQSCQEMARAVLESFGVRWDNEFVDDDGNTVGRAALEALDARLQVSEPMDGREDEEGDDDDASLSWNWERTNLEARKSDTEVEVLVMRVRNNTLVLNPEWQRAYVWSSEKQRRLVESILLGLPIPSFLFHRDSASGKTYVIDGRQRLETLSRFMEPKPRRGRGLRFRTFDGTTDGWKAGQPLHAAAGKYYEQLPPDMKSRIDGAAMVINTFVDLPPGALYQIFKRYNTGAVALKAQEIRNAVYQASPLHQMIYRLAGEGQPSGEERERAAAETLRRSMRRQTQRYGAYAFVGRFFAFLHVSDGSPTVAGATNLFMERFATCSAKQVDDFRDQYLDAFEAVQKWYDDWQLVKSEEEPKWHAFFATVQLVSAARMLEDAKGGRVTAAAVEAAIRKLWPEFAREKALQKQNATLFWGTQSEWIAKLREELASGTQR